MGNRLSTEDVIKQFRNVHGDKYDYFLVDYIKNDKKIKIKCLIHGIFEQTPSDHKKGTNCPICSDRRITQEQAISKFKETHGDKYDYSQVKYIDKNTKVTIICPEHGEFNQLPAEHIKGANCLACSRKSFSKEKIITQFKKIHGDKYEYSKINYINGQTNITITCKEHGDFLQAPSNHKKGMGCPKCQGRNRSKEDWLLIFKEKNGNKYDYSKMEYKNKFTKVKIICPIHGEFEQLAQAHKDGVGCPKCSGRNLSNEDIIKEFKAIYGDKYDYSKVNYINYNKEIEIICKKHGVFKQKRKEHLKGKECPVCTGKVLETETLIKRFKDVHENKYDYSLVNFINAKNKVKVICKKHGVFEIFYDKHLKGTGCYKCNNIKINENIIKEFKEVHGNRYDYSLVDYKNSKDKVKIICKKHGLFFQKYSDHKNKTGCPKCAGRNRDNEEIIKEFKNVHGDKYDYSLVDYKNSKDKVKIICKEHGIFEQNCNNHKQGDSCPRCSNRTILNEDLIKEFQEVYGDKYDYSLIDYKGRNTKIKILCRKHGVFEEIPFLHKNGMGCNLCKEENIQMKVITQFREIHGNTYDYSLVKYKGSFKNVVIICKEHGKFKQTPTSHKRGGNCPKCRGYGYSNKEIIKQFKDIHGDRYDYSLVKFINKIDRVKIICKEHGVFEQKVSNHLKGNDCKKCANNILNKDRMISELNKIHGNKYDYSLLEYNTLKDKVNIICSEHGIFEQKLASHKQGSNCPKCSTTGFQYDKPSLLYYLKIENNGFIAYKIGITNNSVKQRFGKDLKYISILKEWYYEYGEECFQQEQKILNDFKYARWKGPNLLESGNTEIFDRDILLLDN